MIKATTFLHVIDRDQVVRIAAWFLAILLSWLPDILYYELAGNVPKRDGDNTYTVTQL